MNIIYVLGVFPSPTEYFILNEILELEKEDINIIILCLDSNKIQKKISFDRTVIYNTSPFSILRVATTIRTIFDRSLKSCKIFKDYKKLTSRSFLKALKDFSIASYFFYKVKDFPHDHIHSHFASFPTNIAYILSKLLKINFSFTAHANDIYTNTDLIWKIDKSKFLITCTKYNQDYLNNLFDGVAAHKIFCIYHGIELSKWTFIPRKISSSRIISILCVGRLVEKKGIIFLLMAIQKLIAQGYNIKCHLIGEGPEANNLKSFCLENKILNVVNFVGFLPQDQIKSYYYASDIFILPSIIGKDGDRDGLPNVLIEAIACGLPVISTRVSAIEEIIEDGITGFLATPENSDILGEKILKLISDPSLSFTLALSARNKIEQVLDIRQSTIKLMDTFSYFLNEK